ncbi:unnamed protein product, partial [Prorocentrum cordatum]
PQLARALVGGPEKAVKVTELGVAARAQVEVCALGDGVCKLAEDAKADAAAETDMAGCFLTELATAAAPLLEPVEGEVQYSEAEQECFIAVRAGADVQQVQSVLMLNVGVQTEAFVEATCHAKAVECGDLARTGELKPGDGHGAAEHFESVSMEMGLLSEANLGNGQVAAERVDSAGGVVTDMEQEVAATDAPASSACSGTRQLEAPARTASEAPKPSTGVRPHFTNANFLPPRSRGLPAASAAPAPRTRLSRPAEGRRLAPGPAGGPHEQQESVGRAGEEEGLGNGRGAAGRSDSVAVVDWEAESRAAEARAIGLAQWRPETDELDVQLAPKRQFAPEPQVATKAVSEAVEEAPKEVQHVSEQALAAKAALPTPVLEGKPVEAPSLEVVAEKLE